MSMNDLVRLALAWVAGTGFGALFFGGLWWTVRKGLASPAPALWFAGSAVVRTAAVLVGLYWVSAGHWERMIACLLGFVMARLVVARLVGPSARPDIHPVQEAHRAP